MKPCPIHKTAALNCDHCFLIGRQLLHANAVKSRSGVVKAVAPSRLATRGEWDAFLREFASASIDCSCHGDSCSCKLNPGRSTKSANAVEPDTVAVLTCETVDYDQEVVLAGGADLTRFRKNPVILLCHPRGAPGEFYPLPVGRALWVKREGDALIAGIRFTRASTMGREIAGLFADNMMSGFSIGFSSLASSPPTREEKAAHPEWAKAVLIHRKWKLLEASVVSIPANEDCLGRPADGATRNLSIDGTPIRFKAVASGSRIRKRAVAKAAPVAKAPARVPTMTIDQRIARAIAEHNREHERDRQTTLMVTAVALVAAEVNRRQVEQDEAACMSANYGMGRRR